jgi:pimeloyl-ACP methyl ester carboxylesterase
MNSLYPSGSIERLEARLAVDDRAGLVESFMREVVRASPEDVSVMRAQRAWPQRLAAAHTIPRELRAHRDYTLLPERFAEIRVPALILLGAESPTRFRVQSEAAAAALPYSQLIKLPGQRHAAVDTAPGLFVRELVEFLRDTF